MQRFIGEEMQKVKKELYVEGWELDSYTSLFQSSWYAFSKGTERIEIKAEDGEVVEVKS